jgi:hypothetical protein
VIRRPKPSISPASREGAMRPMLRLRPAPDKARPRRTMRDPMRVAADASRAASLELFRIKQAIGAKTRQMSRIGRASRG